MSAAKWLRMRLAMLVLSVLLAAPTAARADDPMWGGPPGTTPPGGAPAEAVPYVPYAPVPYAPVPYAPPAKVTREISYGHQTLISDGIAALLIASAFTRDDPYSGLMLVVAGADIYALGGPIVHFANRQVGNGFKSLGLRVGLPYLGAMAGNLIGPKDQLVCDGGDGCGSSKSSAIGIVVGAGLGAIAAVAIDARFLAKKRVTELAPSFAPTASYSPAGWSVGLAGSF
jgi:hypothetical protein